MEKQIKCTGIVLRRTNFGEADQIVTILSKEMGKIALFVKGSRRLKSRFCGKLELFYEGVFNYYQGRELGHLNEVQSFSLLDEPVLDLKSRAYLFYMAEATEKLIADSQECEEVYTLLKNTLLELNGKNAEVIFYAYMVKLLTQLGFMAPWNVCNYSQAKLDLKKPYYLCSQDASIRSSDYTEPSDTRLTPSIIKWVNFIQKVEISGLKNIRPNTGEKTEIYFVLKSVLGTILNKPFRSEIFIQTLSR